jgi:hypothetical protein
MIARMLALALSLPVETGIHLGEIGEELGVLGGLALLAAGLFPSARRPATIAAGVALTAGFACLAVATRYGHFI